MIEPLLIILAAGQGTRLRPYTDNLPKCMVRAGGRPLLHWQLDAAQKAGFRDILVIGGYRAEYLDAPEAKIILNPNFADTNMVATLLCARKMFRAPLVVSYGDIVYEPGILSDLADRIRKGPEPVAVSVDMQWEGYWRNRFGDPLADAETLKMKQGHIVEIGQKPESLDDIQAQYMGLSAYSDDGIKAVLDICNDEAKANARGTRLLTPDRDLSQAYMTDLIQELINTGVDVAASEVHGGWLEVDSPSDLELADEYLHEGPSINRNAMD